MEYEVTITVKELVGYTVLVRNGTEEEIKKRALELYNRDIYGHRQRLSSSIEDIKVKKQED